MKRRILIVDDDTSILRALTRVLQKNGYETDTAETANQALLKLKNCHYDLALIDNWLEDMKGTELLVKAKKELQSTIKFIITGYPSGEVGAKAREEGADAFILKPINMSELLSIIHVFLNDIDEGNPYFEEEENKKLTLSDVDSGTSSNAR